MPDGYTLLIVANPFVINPSQRSKPYDPVTDFVPLSKVAIIPLVLTISSTVPINNVKGLVEYVKANPGKQAAGLNIVESGYKSTAQSLNDVLVGHIVLFPVVVPSVLPHLKSGRIRILGVFDCGGRISAWRRELRANSRPGDFAHALRCHGARMSKTPSGKAN